MDANGWQDIATAPRDGSFLLGWCGEAEIIIWSDQNWRIVDDGVVFPTHWQPLPGAPEVGA